MKYNFAHGGKDGVPYPIARKIYDKSISYLISAIEGAEIEREERIQALKKLGDVSARMFNRDRYKGYNMINIIVERRYIIVSLRDDMGIKTDNPCNMMCLNIQFQFVNYVMLEMC